MNKKIELITGYEELLNHSILKKASLYVGAVNTTKCCATGTCAFSLMIYENDL